MTPETVSSASLTAPAANRNAVASTLAAILAPYLGENMARASVASQLERLGMAQDTLTAAQMATLVEKIGQGLNVFLGRARASSLVDAMKAAVTQPGKA
jgi:hypothetical protein